MMLNTSLINWQKVDGLLPVIIQHAQSAQVLMLGYMNDEALAKTINEGKVTFYSRTKQRLWTKSLDCDNDTLLILANPIGATCHTGEDGCFHQFTQQGTSHWIWFAQLEQCLAEKKNADPASSYTATLHSKGIKKIAQKVGEEAVETVLAAVSQDKPETLSEAADLVYHLTVLLHHQGLAWENVIAKLQERHQGIGLHPEGSNK